ncbi:MAG TPA: hypothetical protein VGJ75_20955 [Dongiaceae bacterium]|jgi:hypothetical protein
MEWIEINLRRSGIALLSCLPHEDAINLSWLVAAGTMTWPDINAALDATIKRAISERLEGVRQSRPGSYELTYEAWQDARSNAEQEIWARYHAQCDTFFADEPDLLGTGLQAIEQVLRRERTLDGFRIARDDALAELSQRLGPPPARSSSCPARPHIAIPPFRPTPTESELTGRMRSAGFVASAEMAGVIAKLADEIAGSIARAACAAVEPSLNGPARD